MMEARGRMLFKPVVSFSTSEDEITVRVDCEDNEEFWFSLTVNSQTLQAMLDLTRLVNATLKQSQRVAVMCCRLAAEVVAADATKPEGT